MKNLIFFKAWFIMCCLYQILHGGYTQSQECNYPMAIRAVPVFIRSQCVDPAYVKPFDQLAYQWHDRFIALTHEESTVRQDIEYQLYQISDTNRKLEELQVQEEYLRLMLLLDWDDFEFPLRSTRMMSIAPDVLVMSFSIDGME